MKKQPLLISLKATEKSQVVQEPQKAPTTWKSKNAIPKLTEKGNSQNRPIPSPHEVYNLVAETKT